MPAHAITFISAVSAIIITVVLSVLLLFSSLDLSPPLSLVPSPKQEQDAAPYCGNTTTVARALGCHFDPMSFSWLPAQCYDAELTEKFLALQPWKWFSSPQVNSTSFNSSEEVSREDVLRGDHEYLFVNWEYHKLHCTYMWRKMHRAFLGVAKMDEYIGNYRHTEHCEDVLTKDEDTGFVLTVIRRKFVSCSMELS